MLVYVSIQIYTWTEIHRQRHFSIFFWAFPGVKKGNCHEPSHERILPCRMGKAQKLPACSSDDMEIMLSTCKDIGLKTDYKHIICKYIGIDQVIYDITI